MFRCGTSLLARRQLRWPPTSAQSLRVVRALAGGTRRRDNPDSNFITPRSVDASQWYQDVIRHGDLAEHGAVRGMMIIRPNGYAVWEAVRDWLDARIKETGHRNMYFPMLIPLSMLSRCVCCGEGVLAYAT